MKIITNGLVFTKEHTFASLHVVIEGEKIIDLISDIDCFQGERIDAGGGYIVPGFMDIHTHGICGHDTMEGTEDALRSMAAAYVCHGITSFLPTTITAHGPEIRQALLAIAALCGKMQGSAVVLGCHMEGPFIEAAYKGAQPAEWIIPSDISCFTSIASGLSPIIKLVTLAPEKEGSLDLIYWLKEKGITVSCGHSGASFEQMQQAITAGVTHATHLFNGMNPLHHRQPGVAGAALICDKMTVEIIGDLVHLHPGIVSLILAAKGPHGCVLVSDSMMATMLGDGEYYLGGQKVIVKNGEARLQEGNLAGSTLTLDRAIQNLIKKVGLLPEIVIPMATSNPARVIREDYHRGEIKKGYIADICMMDKTWTVQKTIVKGQLCFCAG